MESSLRKCLVCGLEAWTEEELEKFVKCTGMPYDRRTICKECHNKRRRKSRFRLISESPYYCYFCGKKITKLKGMDKYSLVVHSLDGNHNNWNPENKVPAHNICHLEYHSLNKPPKSKETCKKLSEALKGHSVSEETRRKISEANKGRKHSIEFKQKISRIHKGRKFTIEQRRKIALSKLGSKNPNWKGDEASEYAKKIRKKPSDII